MTVNVATNAGSPLTNSATVSGGGSASATATDATNITAGAGSITPAAGTTPQTATLGKAFAVKLAAIVKDGSNNPVSGVVVTFTAASSGATGVFANMTHTKTATTDANGLATASGFTANNVAGTYTVTATAGAVGPANFSLTNKAGTTLSVTPTGGTPQSGPSVWRSRSR